MSNLVIERNGIRASVEEDCWCNYCGEELENETIVFYDRERTFCLACARYARRSDKYCIEHFSEEDIKKLKEEEKRLKIKYFKERIKELENE